MAEYSVPFMPHSEDPVLEVERIAVADRLRDLVHAVDGFDADLRLADMARLQIRVWVNGLAERAMAHQVADALRGGFPSREWEMIALRSAVMRVAGILIILQQISTSARKGGLLDQVDRARLKAARHSFDTAFPDAHAIRNSVAHREEHREKVSAHAADLKKEIPGIQGGGGAWYVSDFVSDLTLYFTYQGRPVGCELSARTLAVLDQVAREYVDLFARIPGAWPPRP